MEIEKRSSKGGFLQLFDWNKKSKKKHFTHKSSENIKQENINGGATPRLQEVNDYERNFGEIDLYNHSVSSQSGDEKYEAKAPPGVIARLMGLDYFPINASIEKHERLAKNPLEFKLLQNRHIKRFQSEILPKKMVSNTHNRVLSPIKSPGFIPPKNAAYVIEAAAKIVEQNPRLTNNRKSTLVGYPSVSMRLHGLKEKIEAAQKFSNVPEVSRSSMNTKMIQRENDDMRSKLGPKNLNLKPKHDPISKMIDPDPISKKISKPGPISKNMNKTGPISKNMNKPGPISKNMNEAKTKKRVESRNSSIRLKQNNQKQNSILDRENLKKPSVGSTSEMAKNKKIINKIVIDTSVGPGKKKKRPISLNDRSDNKSKMNGSDIVSFTFSSPIKKPPRSDSSQVGPIKNDANLKNSGFDVVNGDVLSVLLELKLKELSSRVEFSHRQLMEVNSLSSSCNSFRDSVNSVNSVNSNCSYDEFELGSSRFWERREDFEPSFSEISCNSLNSTEVLESKCCITSEANESVAIRGSCIWELEYIKDIIYNTDLMLEEFVCNQVHQIIEPTLFNQLESNKNLDDPFKVARRALFDCVEECLELKCKNIFSTSFVKVTTLCRSRERLAEDLYREIVGLTNMVDLMVDEVVEMDMSCGIGKWVDFENEKFEVGLEIEKEILSSLIDELFDL